jgi:nucleoporin NUP82
MNGEDDWNAILVEHPIFSKGNDGPSPQTTITTGGTPVPGRRQIMLLRDTDLILARGKEIRICSLAEARNRGAKKTYKVRNSKVEQIRIDMFRLCTHRTFNSTSINLP